MKIFYKHFQLGWKFILIGLIFISVFAIWSSQTIEYTHAEVNIEIPILVEDNRTVSEHVFDLLDEYSYSLDEKITLLAILQCESSMNPYAVNKNAGGSYDLGIAQWNTRYHPEISRACSFDVYCAVRAMAKYYVEEGHYNAWVCS